MKDFGFVFSLLKIIICATALVSCATPQQLSTGTLLVATAKSNDPDFARSVILLTHYDQESAIGLMLNKATSVPISEVLPEAKSKSVTVYAGGPVTIGIRSLIPSKTPPYFTVVSNRTELLRLNSSGVPLFAGYTGWSAQQLQSEVARGLWKVLPFNAATVFDPHPETLWKRLTPTRAIR
jgi:putative transcriptional regulator